MSASHDAIQANGSSIPSETDVDTEPSLTTQGAVDLQGQGFGFDNSGNLYASKVNNSQTSDIVVSSDFGKTWSTLARGVAAGGGILNKTFLVGNDQDVYAAKQPRGTGQPAELYKLKPSGVTKLVGPDVSEGMHSWLISKSGNILFISLISGLWRSADQSMTWSQMPNPGGNFLFGLTEDSRGTFYLLRGTSQSAVVYKSDDDGTTWTAASPSLDGSGKVMTADAEDNVIVIYNKLLDLDKREPRLFRRGKDGVEFDQPINSDLASKRNDPTGVISVEDFEIHKANGRYYALLIHSSNRGLGGALVAINTAVVESADKGATWKVLFESDREMNRFPLCFERSIAYDPKSQSIVWLACDTLHRFGKP